MSCGLITLSNGTKYVFRDDHGHGDAVWAWSIQDNSTKGAKTHKWLKLPVGDVILFDLDSPPATIPYIPLLGD